MSDELARIAAALEALLPAAASAPDWAAYPAYLRDGATTRAVPVLDAPAMDLLKGIDSAKAAVAANVARHAAGHAAHDMLLWGARGMGKSALIRAAVRDVQQADAASIALVQLAAGALDQVPALFAELAEVPRRFIVFIDDLGFAEGDSEGPRALRSWLEGGVAARPGNVRLAVTANRRNIVPRHLAENDDAVNPRDALDDRLALADRFGLALGFHACSQDDYLSIVAGYAAAHGLGFTERDALLWAHQRGARSGRAAWQYVTELAGRERRGL